MIRNIILIFCCCLITLNAFSQVKLKGTVSDTSGETVPYVSIAILDGVDSTKVLASTISDNNGNYILENLPLISCTIYVSSVGYKDISLPYNIFFPSTGNSLTKNITLSIELLSMDEVSVTANNVIQRRIDREVYNITSQQRKNTLTSIDIIAGIPKLSVDYAAQNVTTIDGKSVKILINGANATSRELTTISSENVKSIEYFDIPPARYSEYSSVINIITKYSNDGIYGGVDVLSALVTGFVNAGAYLNYNWGSNQLKVSGSTNYRDYNDIVSNYVYNYKISNNHYRIKEMESRKFGYDDNYITLQYSRNVKDKYQFQLKFAPNFQHSHIDGNLDVNKLIGKRKQNFIGNTRSRTKEFTPTLDIYSLIYLPKQSELYINLTGTYIDASKEYQREDFSAKTSEPVLNDVLNSYNKKKSVIGQVDYTTHLGNNLIFTIGNKTSYGDLRYSLSNTMGVSDNFTKQLQSNIYSELYGDFNKFSFRVNIKANYYNNITNIAEQTEWKFEPQLILNYKFNQKKALRLFFEKTSEIPSLKQLSSAQTYVADNLVNEGNPLLKLSSSYNTILNYDYIVGNRFLVRTGILHDRNLLPINTYFIEKDNMIKLKYENAISSSHIGSFISAYYDPFKNQLLTSKISLAYAYGIIQSNEIGKYNNSEIVFNYEFVSKYKGFTLSYSANVRDWLVSGAYRKLGEKNSTLRLSYTYKNFSFNLSCFWFLAEPNYETMTLAGSIVDYHFKNTIYDNKNMITIGFIYNFGLGKKHSSKKKKFSNLDRDSGLF